MKKKKKSENRDNNIYCPSVEENIAENLKLIWISHPHADHHLGLLMILSERKRILLRMIEKKKRNKMQSLRTNFSNNNDDSNDNISNYNNNGDDNYNELFPPILLIAPPSVLPFL